MADRDTKALLFSHAWTAFGNQLAALLGITVGLLCLLYHVPVWLSSLRGGLAFLGVWFIVRFSSYCLMRLADSSARRTTQGDRR